MINLLNVLSTEDKTKIDNYINLYGTDKRYRVSLDSWLQDWANNKTKLYKLLGNKLTYEVPFEYEEDEAVINQKIRSFCNKNADWFYDLYQWIKNKVAPSIEKDECLYTGASVEPSKFIYFLEEILLYPKTYFVQDCFDYGTVKMKLVNNKKTLSLPKGMKPIRFISRVLNYCKDIDGANKFITEFEEIREAHSLIFNSKKMKNTLVISIHPLDYMTMSDNSLSWSSCMSWRQSGCYRVGTVEMMNSNNVLCCYIKGSEPFNIKEKDITITWNNKKWRQLIYITKDIIVGGKAYPYQKKTFTEEILTILRKLAKENLNWNYSFGIEEYLDMKPIWSLKRMEEERRKIKHGTTFDEHKILFDTKGMYNDMLNDKNTAYWCIRNKVPHTKIISYSGKAPCLCCKQPIIEFFEDEYWEEDHTPDSYNSRYNNTGSVICGDCLDNNFECDFCGGQDTRSVRALITLSNGLKRKICKSCAFRYIKKCPDCGEPFFITPYKSYSEGICQDTGVAHPYKHDDVEYFIKVDKDVNSNFVYQEDIHTVFKDSSAQDEAIKEIFKGRAYLVYSGTPSTEKYLENFKYVVPICLCSRCKSNISDRFTESVAKLKTWYASYEKDIAISNDLENKEDWMDYFYTKLKDVEFEELDGKTITL